MLRLTETETDKPTYRNSQIQDPVSWVGGKMRQHSGSIVSISKIKKVYKNKEKKNVLHAVAYTTIQL